MLPLLLEPPIESFGLASNDDHQVASAPVAEGAAVVLEQRILYRFETVEGNAAYLFCFGDPEGSAGRYLAIADHWERPRALRADPWLISYLQARYDLHLLPSCAPLDATEREAAMLTFAIAPAAAIRRAWISTVEVRERSTAEGVTRMVMSYDHRGGEVRYLFLQRLADGQVAPYPVADVISSVLDFTRATEGDEAVRWPMSGR